LSKRHTSTRLGGLVRLARAEARLAGDPAGQQRIACALKAGLESFFGSS